MLWSRMESRTAWIQNLESKSIAHFLSSMSRFEKKSLLGHPWESQQVNLLSVHIQHEFVLTIAINIKIAVFISPDNPELYEK